MLDVCGVLLSMDSQTTAKQAHAKEDAYVETVTATVQAVCGSERFLRVFGGTRIDDHVVCAYLVGKYIT